MALTAAEQSAILDCLAIMPEASNADIRAQLNLPSTAIFQIAALRRRAGIPEPPGAGKPGRKRGSASRGGSHRRRSAAPDPATASDTLDASGPADGMAAGGEPTRRAGKAKSPLALFKPQAIEGLSLWLQGATGGRNPANAMTAQEAQAVAGPAVRSADRFLAKYVKLSGPQNEYVADLAAIGLALAAYLLRVVIQGMQARQNASAGAGGGQVTPRWRQDAMAEQAAIHRFNLRAEAASATPADDGDGGDLFAGSEPVRQGPTGGGGAAERGNSTGRAAVSGPAGAVAAGDEFWNTVSPPEIGAGGVVA